MDKNTSISLHLAKVMGLNGVELLPFGESGSQVAYIDGSGMWFLPFTSRAQWADVVLWAADQHITSTIMRMFSYASAFKGEYAPCSYEVDCVDAESRMAATLEAIALATGWAG